MMTFTTQYPKLIFPGKSQFTNTPPPKGIKIQRLYSSINPISWWRLRKQIKAQKPDLIINRFWLPYLGVSAAHLMKPYSKEPSIKSISIIDNLIPHQKMPGDNALIKHYMNSHSDFIVMSSSVGNEIDARFENKNVLHIPHPIYDHYGDSVEKKEAQKKLNLDPEYKYLLFFGFIKPYKGLQLLLDSLDKSYLEKEKIKLLIAGEVYGDVDPYTNKIQDRNLMDHVIFHNKYISDEEVKYYFSACDLVVQTYLTATQSGISQIALYYEKAVLVTDVGGLSEMVLNKKTGYVVNKNEADIMDAVKDFFDHNREESFNSDIKDLKAYNSWEAFAQKLLDFIFSENQN